MTVWKGSIVIVSDNAVSLNAAHHLALFYDSAANTSYLMIDGVVQTQTYAGNIFGGITDPDVTVGAYRNGGTPAG